MPTLTQCPSCCENCLCAGPSIEDFDSGGSFALRNLLPVGTLSLRVRDHGWNDAPCDHVHLDDGWHKFSRERVQAELEDPSHDQRTVDQLSVLLEHDFVRIRCRLGSEQRTVLLARIYLVPFDLAGIQGRLRRRQETVLVICRPILREILSKLSCCPHLWEGETCLSSDCIQRGFLDTSPVGRIQH